ncbi:hypothetical protein [Caldimonas sp. KR1-144]|uniref:hypothetical protein n=1 Tax=Caldimonas sp. KR1-144 TaxID=3400911 RepID=UPI003C0EC69D
MTTIYRKTAQGQAEIDVRTRRLSPRVRSALIMVDGKRSDDELLKMIPQAEEALKELLDGGLIEAISVSRPAVAPAPAMATRPVDIPVAAAPAAPAVDVIAVRREAVRALNDLLGPQAESLAIKLEKVTDVNELRMLLERAVTYISTARGGGPAAQFANRFLSKLEPPLG